MRTNPRCPAVRFVEMGEGHTVLFTVGRPAIPLLLVARIAFKVLRGFRYVSDLLRYSPQFMLITSAWCFGAFVGYLTGRKSAP